jgi:hypothetical protein
MAVMIYTRRRRSWTLGTGAFKYTSYVRTSVYNVSTICVQDCCRNRCLKPYYTYKFRTHRRRDNQTIDDIVYMYERRRKLRNGLPELYIMCSLANNTYPCAGAERERERECVCVACGWMRVRGRRLKRFQQIYTFRAAGHVL